MTRSARIFALLLVLLLLCACAAEPMPVPDVPEPLPQEEQPAAPTLPARQASTGTLRESSEDDVLTILEALTSADFAGRVVGSEGNEKAAAYLAGQLSDLGYEPYGADYLLPYTDDQVQPERAEASLTILFPDGTRTALTPGEDFIWTPVYDDLDVTLPLSPSSDETNAGRAIFCDPTDESRIRVEEGKSAIAFNLYPLRSHSTSNNSVGSGKRGLCFVMIDESLRDTLSQPGLQAELRLSACGVQDGTAYNVAAVRRGSGGGREAVVVGAHFDGSGFYGDALYPSAYDNASGTTTLLTAAALLADVQLDADLIFVGFNGEESVLDGSAALAEPLCAAYESLALINIDCIGLKSESDYMLDGNTAAFSGLGERFGDEFVLCLTDNMNSDHKSFLGRENVYATNLSDAGATNYSYSLMHTRLDTVDGLDPARILRAAQTLAQYLFAGEYPSRLSS